ncbi:hypothetical protein AFK76_12765 [Idiomarina zobellii]|uniref:Uncharacterized protein n=1 Tax=Idiomarina zobellii TaxID=86103 RepID=A0A837NGK0_9GAMM|nr:hypothetical protein AFK76_12765 [Idiomarina zobellii]
MDQLANPVQMVVESSQPGQRLTISFLQQTELLLHHIGLLQVAEGNNQTDVFQITYEVIWRY